VARPSGRLDRAALLAFAKGRKPGGAVPYMYSGSTCEQGAKVDDPPTDGGLTEAQLVRDCNGTFRLFLSGVSDGFRAVWVEIDARAGGCEGVDVVAVVFPEGEARRGVVVATPSCASSTWSALAPAGTAFHPHVVLDVAGSTFGDPARFGWRAGATDGSTDLAPDRGLATFAR
jgi:hypothetical protein